VFVGPPGRLKSSIIKRATKGNAVVISCNASHVEVFCEVQRQQLAAEAAGAALRLVLDDADSLYGTDEGRRLLKHLTEPLKPATVSHHTNYPEKLGLKKVFTTSAQVCIIDNAWGGVNNEHVQAVEDRGRLFYINPPVTAVHKRMANEEWFTDTEIYDFVGEHLHWISYDEGPGTGKGLSVRLYVKALEAKEAGEDWRDFILKQYIQDKLDKDLLLVYSDPYFAAKSVEEKCQAWMTKTRKSRSTFFDRKRALLARLISTGANTPVLGRLSPE
jgi:hypothetical protein